VTKRQASFPAALAALIVIPFGMWVSSAVHIMPRLDKATAQQCRTHDWPEHQHQAHMDFCTTYGYPTN
jgi:hypothetical protein